MDAKEIGGRIAKLRGERNMTQTELADRPYVTEKAVSKWECGNGIPDLDNIGKLAELFDISIDELLLGEERNKRDTVSEEQILQLEKGDYSFIKSYEDIVVHSSNLSRAMINELAIEFIDTITRFEEIIYLLDDFTQETLQRLCLHHRGKIAADTDLSPLLGRIDSNCFSALCECKQKA